MTSLLTNNSAMTALTTLKSINTQLDATSNRVSTGQRVSNASDNAAYWSIATTVRTDNASLSAVKDSLGLGSSAVDTTYNGLNSIITDLQNMRAKLQTALQPGVDRAKVQTEIAAIQSKMKATADSSNSSGQNWLSVDSSATNAAYQGKANVVAGFSRDATGAISFSKVEIDVGSIKLFDVNSTSVTTAATSAKVVGSTSLTGTTAFTQAGAGPTPNPKAGTVDFLADVGGGANRQINIVLDMGGAEKATIQLDKDTLKSSAKDLGAVTTDELLTAINNQISASGSSKLAGKVTAALDTAGRLTFETKDTTTPKTLKIANGSATSSAFALADIGFGATANGPQLMASSAYAGMDISAGSKALTINDGISNTVVTLDQAAYTAAGASVTSGAATLSGADAVTLINEQLKAANSNAIASFDGSKISFTTTGGGSSSSVTVTASDTEFGFTAGQTAVGTDVASAKGTAAGTSSGKGILDTVLTGTGFSISGLGAGAANTAIDISKLVGTAGDEKLSAIITQVDKAIASVTNAGTKLGASKTQIDGQKAFVDTLMKANDRTIGILVDADIEEESTKLKALQTQQQLAVQALSIANSASQNVLSLFR